MCFSLADADEVFLWPYFKHKRMSVVEMREKKTQQNWSMVPRFNASITDISKQIYAHTMGP